MTSMDPNGRAELIDSMHQPWKATLGECLNRWRALDAGTRARSYLVVHAGAERRHTLTAGGIAELAASV